MFDIERFLKVRINEFEYQRIIIKQPFGIFNFAKQNASTPKLTIYLEQNIFKFKFIYHY